MPATRIEAQPTTLELATAIVSVLAEIRQVSVADLEAQRMTGDLEMDSPEGVAVIATLQTTLGRRLAQVQDLEPEQLTSVATLAELIHRRWPAGAPMPAGEGS